VSLYLSNRDDGGAQARIGVTALPGGASATAAARF
jgi:hypothetical protein